MKPPYKQTDREFLYDLSLLLSYEYGEAVDSSVIQRLLDIAKKQKPKLYKRTVIKKQTEADKVKIEGRG